MRNIFTFLICLLVSVTAQAQITITQWNFNNSDTVPNIGTGSLQNIGGTSVSFASGSASGGSSDPASTNQAYNTSSYPAQSTAPKTAGIEFAVSTVGYENIIVSFDQRFSNTANNTFVLQYTTDITATTPVWTDAFTFTFTPQPTGTGDSWFNNRSYNFSSVPALNNNANAGFRIVSNYDPIAGVYLAARSTSNYSTSGTARFDMVTVSGSLPAAVPFAVEFIKDDATVLENTGNAKVRARVLNVGNAAGSVDLQISSYSTATASADYSLMNATANLSPSMQIGDTIDFNVTIVDDALAESDEYIICTFTNATNVNFSNSEQHTLYIRDNDISIPAASDKLKLTLVTSFSNGPSSSNSAEIVAYDSASRRLYIANSIGNRLDIISFANPATPAWVDSIDLSIYGNINSVAVANSIVACAIENGFNPQAAGSVVFFDTNGVYINSVPVGAMPDMLTFNHAKNKIYVANEGEPNGAYTVDPDGSVSVIDISGGVASVSPSNVSTISFAPFNGFEAMLRAMGVRIYGPSANTEDDVEPEYITISDDDTRAWVSLQENNAIAELNLISNTVVAIHPLGYKDHSLAANAFDASNNTDSINISTYPVWGMYQPDAIAQYSDGSNIYILSANEGDARDYAGFSEELRMGSSSYLMDSIAFPNSELLKNNSVLGRLNSTKALGDTNNDGRFDRLYAYGARSFSVWDATTSFSQLYDSKNEFELITAYHPVYGSMFNASNGNSISKKNRSDDKGPEPEGVIVAKVNNTPYAFIGLERIGGVMVYDITNPAAPQYVTYANNRGPDHGTEGLIFIPYTQSADSNNYLVLANETSSTLTIYKVEENCTSMELGNTIANNTATVSGSATASADQNAAANVNYYTNTCKLLANISNNTAALGATTIQVFTDTTISTHNGQPFVARWYQITPDSNNSADVKLFFTQNDFDNYNTFAALNGWPLLPGGPSDVTGLQNLRITKNDNAGLGNNPLVITPTAAWDGTNNIWTLSFNTPSFSQFRVHAANLNNTPLPVSDLILNGYTTANANMLQWHTLREENNSYFVVEHSRDGIYFENIGTTYTKALLGNSTTKLSYKFVHNNPSSGKHYYRLQQMDIDGASHYSNVIALTHTNTQVVRMYPSPVQKEIHIVVPSEKRQNINISLFDISGRLIFNQQESVDQNNDEIVLNMQHLTNGIYTIVIRAEQGILSQEKLIKN